MSEIRQKQPRLRDERYLMFVRRQPCCVCGQPAPSDAAHIRMGDRRYGKAPTGMQEKPDDRWAVSLCRPVLGVKRGCHKNQHAISEAEFWSNVGLNPFEIAKNLYALGGHPEDPQPKRKKWSVVIPKGGARKIPSRPFPTGKRKFSP